MQVLKRGAESFAMQDEEWAEALLLATRFGWNPPGSTIDYLSSGFSVSADEACELAGAFERVFAQALRDPSSVYPVAVDMGRLYLLKEFLLGGALQTSDK